PFLFILVMESLHLSVTRAVNYGIFKGLRIAEGRYFCDLNGDGAYRVKDIRSELDDLFLPSSAVATRWVNLVPIKVNIFA
nr:RNA-directed DNA polymerase, eukaryota [Tanacetum cinerariifolium]